MHSDFAPIILGILIVILGFFNMRGDISSVHWYHRKRVTEENRLAFGKMIGLGTIICGMSLSLFGVFSLIAHNTQNTIFLTIGSAIIIIGLLTGLTLSFYAMIKYNKGIF